MSDHRKIVEFLSHARAYPDPTARVERIETHISWVFLTDQFAYKLKKPVAFDFLDFSTLELRRAACEDEVRLNRRLAKNVYLGVLPITQTDQGDFMLGGSGDPIDYVVKMVRLPAERALDRLIAAGGAASKDMERLADRLAAFYQTLSPLAIEPATYRRQIEAHVRANLRDLSALVGGSVGPLLKQVHGSQLQRLLIYPEMFGERIRAGRIVEGHGDLRPEHVYFLPEPVVLDCIEFNAEYRRLDVLDELGFLAMECDRLGAAELGNTVLNRCAEQLNDNPSPDLMAFYKSYRACVRAKVAALRGSQHEGSERDSAQAECHAYLGLAAREVASLLRPLVVVVRGLSGVGKSTVAAALSESLGATRLSTDEVRRDLFSVNNASASQVVDRYSPEHREAVYEELFRRADTLLQDGCSVVLDGTFLQASQSSRAAALAKQHSAPLLVVECRCPEELARERIAERIASGPSASDAFPELHGLQKQAQEPLPADLASCIIDTTAATEKSVEEIVAQLAGIV